MFITLLPASITYHFHLCAHRTRRVSVVYITSPDLPWDSSRASAALAPQCHCERSEAISLSPCTTRKRRSLPPCHCEERFKRQSSLPLLLHTPRAKQSLLSILISTQLIRYDLVRSHQTILIQSPHSVQVGLPRDGSGSSTPSPARQHTMSPPSGCHPPTPDDT